MKHNARKIKQQHTFHEKIILTIVIIKTVLNESVAPVNPF